MLKDDELQSNAALLKQCRQTFDRWEAFASSRYGTSTMFLWAAAETTVWPIIPDFFLVPMSVANRRRFVVPLAAAVAGMAVGGTATYLFAYWRPQHALDFLHHVPLAGNREIEAVGRRLTKEGVGAYWLQPWSDIPYKVWGVVGGIRKLNLLLVIPTFILARAIRNVRSRRPLTTSPDQRRTGEQDT